MSGNVMVATALAIAVVLGAGTEADASGAPKLVKYKIVDENSIPQNLTGKKGDPVNGRKLAINRNHKNATVLQIDISPPPD